MSLFILGFFAGFILRDKILETSLKCIELYHTHFKQLPKIKKPKFYILSKINDKKLFNELFPDLGTKFRTQPTWEFYENKNVIKIEIDEQFDFLKDTSYEECLNITGLDIEFFKSFSDLFIYIHYFNENKEYINVYTSGSIIKHTDFEINESRYKSVICAIFRLRETDIYITSYFKKFLNNRSLKTEHLLLYYDNLDRLDATLELVFDKNTKTHSLNESI